MTERKIPYDFIHMWNLKDNEQLNKTETNS